MREVFICLPYRNHDWKGDSATMVYAGVRHPFTDGDILRITYDADGKPLSFELVSQEK